MFALYRKKVHADGEHPHRTLPQLAHELVCRIAQALPGRRIIVAVDGLYATKDFFGELPANVAAVSRLRKDAALRTANVPARTGGGGRPRLRGDRLAGLEALKQQAQDWKTVELRKQGRTVRRRICGLNCQWYHVCRGKPVRVVFVQDPDGVEDDLHAVSTDPALSDQEIVQEFYDRWGIEESIQEGKQQMGMERTRGWCARTVSRQAPLAMLLGSLVKLWHLQCRVARGRWHPQPLPWYPQKNGVSFRDMLAALRWALWQDRLLCNFHGRWKSNTGVSI